MKKTNAVFGAATLALLNISADPAFAQSEPSSAEQSPDPRDEMRQIREAINALQKRLDALEASHGASPSANGTEPSGDSVSLARASSEKDDAQKEQNSKSKTDTSLVFEAQCNFGVVSERTSKPTVTLAEVQDNPNEMAKCFRFLGSPNPIMGDLTLDTNEKLKREANALVGAGTIPGAPVVRSGLLPQLTFGNSKRAKLTATFGSSGRLCEDRCSYEKTKITPYRSNFIVEVSTDLEDNVGALLDRRERDDRGDLDFLKGTSIKLGYDRVLFKTTQREQTLNDAIIKAIKKCNEEASKKTGEAKTKIQKLCNPESIAQWAFEPKNDPDKGFPVFVREKEAQALIDAAWGFQPEPRELRGFGFSGTFSDPTFAYRPGGVLETMDEGVLSLAPDPNIQLGKEITEGRAQWELEGHIFRNFPISDPTSSRSARLSDIMPVLQLKYRSITEFRPSTAATVCVDTIGGPFDDLSTQTFSDCKATQVERAQRLEQFTGLAELRFKFVDVPHFGQVGVAPRIAHTFETDQTFLDLPLFVSDKDGKFSAGIRGRIGLGGRNVFTNKPEKDFQEISLFFVPLRFDAF